MERCGHSGLVLRKTSWFCGGYLYARFRVHALTPLAALLCLLSIVLLTLGPGVVSSQERLPLDGYSDQLPTRLIQGQPAIGSVRSIAFEESDRLEPFAAEWLEDIPIGEGEDEQSPRLLFEQGPSGLSADCYPSRARLYWDNVEGAPHWLSGCPPKLQTTLGMHVVELLSGAHTRLLLPGDAILRIVNPHGKLTPSDVNVWVSNGTGVFRLHRPAISEQGHSLMVSPGDSRPSVVIVERAAAANCSIELALFVSRYELPTASTPHCLSVLAGCEKVKVTRLRDRHTEEFLRVQPNQYHQLATASRGPLVIETRLRYPAAEGKRHQVYQLLVKFNGERARVVDFETVVESRELLAVDGCVAVLGRLQTDYLCVPTSIDKVEISSTADLLVRVRPCAGCSCDRNNVPRGPCGPACIANSFPWPGRRSIWDLNAFEINSAIQVGPDGCIPIAALHRIARDNAYRGGGLSSLMLARAQAAKWSQEPHWGQLTQRVEGMHTGFRHVLPSELGTDRSQHFAWYYARDLRPMDISARGHVVARQLVEEALDKGLSSGYFSVVPPDPARPLVYHLETEEGPTLLRLAFDRRQITGPETIYLQLNDREPVTLRVGTGNDLPVTAYEPTLGETALAGLHGMHGTADVGTLGGPFGQTRTPSVFLPAGTTTLLVPRDTQLVRVWSSEPTSLSVALQLRKSNPFELSERLYLELAAREGMGSESFWNNMTRPLVAADLSFAAAELRNHWQPLMRLLRQHERRFVASVRAPTQAALTSRLPSPDVARWTEQAQAAEARQDWALAVESWSRVLDEGLGSSRPRAAEGQLEALIAQGEHNLAERAARGMYLYDEDPAVRAHAHRFLVQRYVRNGDRDALEQLAATAALRDANTDRVLELTQSLFDNARFDYAFLIGMSLPEAQRPLELMVRCAYQIRWWRAFQQLVTQLPSVPQRNFWQAQRLTQQGEYGAALTLFRQAGPPGHEFADKLTAGRGILRMLQSSDVATRAQGILQWETWTKNHPGPYLWREDGTQVASSPGGNLLYSVDRDISGRYYRATPHEPLVLIVNGPARIELTARPRHKVDATQPLDDWLNVHLAGQHYVFPITSNAKSDSLTIIGDQGHLPGDAVVEQIHVGPGRHRLLVHADQAELFVQSRVECPEWRLPILPPINRVTLDAALAGSLHLSKSSGLQAPTTLLGADCEVCELEHVLACPETGLNADRMLAGVASELAARMAIRTDGNIDWYRSAIAELALKSQQLDPLERLLAFERGGILEGSEAAILGRSVNLPTAVADAYRMARSLPPDLDSRLTSGADVMRRFVLLTHTAEYDSDRRDELSILGRQLELAHPELEQLQSLAARLTWNLNWERREQVDRSAGISSRQLERWEPETPLLRNRAALAAELLPTEHVLLGPDTLVLATREIEPSSLEAALRLLDIGYTPQVPARVRIEVDGVSRGTVEVRPGEASNMALDLSDGQHAIGWRFVDPKLGQMARLAVKIRRRGSRLAEDIAPEIERVYHVATVTQPIEFTARGPGVVRIDQQIGDATSTRHVNIGKGAEKIVLTPGEGQERALYRVFESVPDPASQRTYPPQLAVAPVPVPSPLVGSIDLPTDPLGFGDVQLASFQQPDDVGSLSLLPPDTDHVVVDDVDRQVLGAQEDGTWDLGVGWYDRQLIEESPGNIGIDRFLEMHGIHRIFREFEDIYLRNEFLLRTRDSSGPTVAYRHRGWWELDASAWDVSWSGYTYTQRPIPIDSSVQREQEWILGGDIEFTRRWYLAPCWRHTPAIAFFGRTLSLDRNPYGPGRIDQDIFTRFKADHRYGWQLADRFTWEQYEDRRWWIAPFAYSTEDLGVDHFGARAGLQQAIGRLDFDLSYRFTRYLANGDRPLDVNQHLLFLDAHLHRWNVLGRRVEVSTYWRQGLADGRSSFNLVLSWYFDRGRQYRDFHPSELRFPELRKQRAEYDNSPWLLE